MTQSRVEPVTGYAGNPLGYFVHRIFDMADVGDIIGKTLNADQVTELSRWFVQVITDDGYVLARADAEAERDRLREALLGTAERRLTDSDDSPCWCIDAPWVGHPSPYSTSGSEHDDFCAKARAALNPEDQR